MSGQTKAAAAPRSVPGAQEGRLWIAPAAAAQRAEVTAGTVLHWCSKGILQGRKVGGRWRIDAADLTRLLAGRDAA